MTIAPKTFLITGVSSGLGRAFAEGALAAGHKVIGTVRRAEDADPFAALKPDRAHPLLLDVTDFAAIPDAVRGAETATGKRASRMAFPSIERPVVQIAALVSVFTSSRTLPGHE